MLKANVIGLGAYLSKIQNASKEIQAGVAGELQAAAFKFRDDAKRDLVSQGGDRGGLAKSINAVQNDQLNWTVAASVFYAPYIEFGTKRKVKIPAGFEDVAAESRGLPKRGDYYDFLNSILDWVKRKGIGRTYNVKTRRKDRQTKDQFLEIAERIAFSIRRNGISPKPFFYKQVTPVRTQLEQRVKKLLSGI
jgi:hypothetical protein